MPTTRELCVRELLCLKGRCPTPLPARPLLQPPSRWPKAILIGIIALVTLTVALRVITLIAKYSPSFRNALPTWLHGLINTVGYIWIGIVALILLYAVLNAVVQAAEQSQGKRRTKSIQTHRCVKCSYDLTGTTSDRCPECGYWDPARVSGGTFEHSTIPKPPDNPQRRSTPNA